MMRKKAYSDILPHFGVTSCLARRDILPWRERDILPSQLRDILPRPVSPPACLLARQKPQRRHNTMFSKDPHGPKNARGTPPQSASTPTNRSATSSRKVTEARATAQRAKLDDQAQTRRRKAEDAAHARSSPGKRERERLGGRRGATIEGAIADYLLDHAGGNHSPKTLEWHRTALTLMQAYLEEECKISLVEDIDAPELNGWLAHLRKIPGSHGKPRSERTIQTYARSARAFFHWLVRRELIERNPFDRVTFPKVGKPLIQTIDADEFERLLLACTPPHESGPIAERAAVRNRAILWVLYDTGIRVSELCGLRLSDFDRKHGVLTVTGKGSKERRIALGSNCLRNLLYYLDRYRPDEEELAEWGSTGEDHLFLSETRLPLTKNGSRCSSSASVNERASPASASARTSSAIPSPSATWCWAMTPLASRNCWGMRI